MSTKNGENIGPGEGNKSAGIDIFVLAQKQHAERRKADEEAERRRILAKYGKDGEGGDGEMGDLMSTGESSILLCGAPKSVFHFFVPNFERNSPLIGEGKINFA
jgi:hypothetical protein